MTRRTRLKGGSGQVTASTVSRRKGHKRLFIEVSLDILIAALHACGALKWRAFGLSGPGIERVSSAGS